MKITFPLFDKKIMKEELKIIKKMDKAETKAEKKAYKKELKDMREKAKKDK